MCGRFTLTTDVATLIKRFNLEEPDFDVAPNYNVAPGQNIPVVVEEQGVRKLELHKWGLIPSWASDPKIGYRMINARSETVAEKPSFRKPLLKQRCLIPATGFYEWKKLAASSKMPYYIQLKAQKVFAMAGLWDQWKSPEGNNVRSCTILTTEPNTVVKGIHDRMPVILARADEAKWINSEVSGGTMTGLFKAHSSEDTLAYRVAPLVNSPQNNSEELITPLS